MVPLMTTSTLDTKPIKPIKKRLTISTSHSVYSLSDHLDSIPTVKGRPLEISNPIFKYKEQSQTLQMTPPERKVLKSRSFSGKVDFTPTLNNPNASIEKCINCYIAINNLIILINECLIRDDDVFSTISLDTTNRIKNECGLIYDTYISEESDQEINITGEIRNQILDACEIDASNNKFVKLESELDIVNIFLAFKSAQSAMFDLLTKDIMPRYLKAKEDLIIAEEEYEQQQPLEQAGLEDGKRKLSKKPSLTMPKPLLNYRKSAVGRRKDLQMKLEKLKSLSSIEQ
eukprot:Awhi_evm1s11951